jgi:hypothetical protein
MADIIDFNTKKPITPEELRTKILLNFANSIDIVVTDYHVHKQCTFEELALILSNRLGEIIRLVPDKHIIIEHLIAIMLKQSGVKL